MAQYNLKAPVVVTPNDVITDGLITINDKKITAVKQAIKAQKTTKKTFELSDNEILFPSMINAHDHLLGSYYPRVLKSAPYKSWKPWDDELKSARVYKERGNIPPYYLYLLGVYKNLITGVTTISDHIPHFVNDPFIPDMPIRILQKYTLAHEVSSYDLNWGDGVDIEFKRAKKKNWPFITHIEEGFDAESKRGVEYLVKKYHALDYHTVLVHGLVLSNEDIDIIARRKANLVWCCTSNMNMYHRTARIKKWIDAGINVSIGTDSPMSADLNILRELSACKKTYRTLYKKDIPDEMLVDMVTRNPAHAFITTRNLGTIKKGNIADLLVVKGNPNKPHKSLVQAKLPDIMLVLFEGKPLYGDPKYKPLFETFKQKIYTFKINNTPKIGTIDPKGLMKKIRKFVGFQKKIPFLPVT